MKPRSNVSIYVVQTAILFVRSSNKCVSNSFKCKFTYLPTEPTSVLVSNQRSSVTKPFNLVHIVCLKRTALFSRAPVYCGLCRQWSSKCLRNAQRMRRIILSTVACPVQPYFSTLSHKMYGFRKERYRTLNMRLWILPKIKCVCFDFIEIKIYVFWFYLTLNIRVLILSNVKMCFDFIEYKICVFWFYRK